MTNREAFNVYYRAQIEKSIRAVESLPDIAFYCWQNEFRDAYCGVKIVQELNWFWFTYGGRDIGKGIDNVVKWLEMEFTGDIEEEKTKWLETDGSWTEHMIERYGMK